ncbi:MAG: HDOD domain-containing protein [Bdellovibrionales bacterium]|nr:HDOD domain-containing protein [Bdellovibrionales bacterium]
MSDKTDSVLDTDGETDLPGSEESVSRRGPKSILLPPEPSVLKEARLLAGDRNVRISRLASTIAQDPIITLELLRVANATFFAGDRPSITTAQTAVIRLGSQTIVEMLDSLRTRPQIQQPEVSREFETLRVLSRRVSVTAQIIANEVQRDISEIAQTAGLMSYIGYMIACAYLAEDYIDILRGRKRSTAAYRIQQEHGLDVNVVLLEYLRSHGVPNELFYGLDRELKCKTPGQAALRFISESAVELVEAFEGGRWDRYAPNQTLPSKSALRLLKISDDKYRTLYGELDDYLRGKRDREKSQTDETDVREEEPASEPKPPAPVATPRAAEDRPVTIKRDGFARSNEANPTLILTRNGFGGYDSTAQPTNFIESDTDAIEEEKQTLSPEAQQVLRLINQLCSECKTSHDLLVRLLKMLITEGPFVRAALILLKTHRQSADIHTAVGEGFVDGSSIAVNDPLSPLALCLTKIQSFNAKDISDILSPFGVSSYAVSPLRIDHESPVVLYADCGLDRPLPLEARKIFRLVVGLLNHTLPRLPGGLPRRAARPLDETQRLSRPEL